MKFWTTFGVLNPWGRKPWGIILRSPKAFQVLTPCSVFWAWLNILSLGKLWRKLSGNILFHKYLLFPKEIWANAKEVISGAEYRWDINADGWTPREYGFAPFFCEDWILRAAAKITINTITILKFSSLLTVSHLQQISYICNHMGTRKRRWSNRL